MAHGEDWTPEENDRLVAVYFDLLNRDVHRIAAKFPAKTINKAQIYRDFGGRSKKSVEWKMRNVSSVLQDLGMPWATGLKPADNIQSTLTDAIDRILGSEREIDLPDLPYRKPEEVAAPVFTRGNNRQLDHVAALIQKYDPAKRDDANRKLGKAGEFMVLEMERRRLLTEMPKRASDLKWVSEVEGDGHGYDIRSFDERGEERFIEVKTTRGRDITPFFVSRNEKRVAEDSGDAYRIFRVFDYDQSPKVFTLKPPLDQVVSMVPHTYIASFR